MNRINVILLVLLLAQGAFFTVDRFVIDSGFTPRRALEGDKLFPAVVPENVASLRIEYQDRVTELKRNADSWVVASEKDAPADQQAVQQLLQRLPELKPGNVVSDNPQKHADFQVEGKDAVHFIARSNSGSVVADAVLGKSTPSMSGVYVRCPPDAREVMLVLQNVRTLFVRDDNKAGAWRDKTIFTADAKTIRKIEIAGKDETIVLERKLAGDAPGDEDDWLITSPVTGQLERYGAKSMVNYIADMKADSFAEDGKSLADLGLEPPAWHVTVTREGLDPLVFDIGNEEGYRRYVHVPGKGDVFLVSAYRLANLIRKASEFPEKSETTETPGPADDPAKADGAADGAKAAEGGSAAEADDGAEKPADDGAAPPSHDGAGGKDADGDGSGGSGGGR